MYVYIYMYIHTINIHMKTTQEKTKTQNKQTTNTNNRTTMGSPHWGVYTSQREVHTWQCTLRNTIVECCVYA